MKIRLLIRLTYWKFCEIYISIFYLEKEIYIFSSNIYFYDKYLLIVLFWKKIKENFLTYFLVLSNKNFANF